uniref:Uncharacterized protein n=1 Tax=Panagrolaimus sp. ES5 TaxID=591445 RepID=A0AC34FWV7_9BILA
MNPGVIIPLLLFLGLIIYFLICLVRGLRRANSELQEQLTHERTEEKKKIFEMAGGGKGKKPGVERASKKAPKKPGQYLSDVESKRREPWRQYNGTDQNSSLCVTDEPDSSALNSPSFGSPEKIPKSKLTGRGGGGGGGGGGMEETSLTSPRIPHSSSPTKRGFRPSLGSLDEVEMSDVPSNSESARNLNNQESIPKSATRATERVEDWYNDGTHSDHSYDVQSAAIEVATPEEIRTFLKPMMELEMIEKGESAVSLAAFPKDSTSPLTVIFGTGSAAASRRSSRISQRDSYISLYDNPSPDDWFAAAATQAAAATAGGIGISSGGGPFARAREMRTGSFSKAFCHPPRPGSGVSQTRSPSPPKSIKVEPAVAASPLTPWPSIEEIRAQRGGLLPIKPPSPRSKSPPKMVKSEHKEDSPIKEMSESGSGPARFRISVSPTRKLTSDSGSDTDTGPKKRRFMIKQRLLPGSTASLASTSSKPLPSTTITPPESSNLLSPRAPRVEFGDDDSPRIQEPPPIPPHRIPK